MNKIQYIKLLEMRGITELKGISIADAVKETGGNPSDKEMVIVNQKSMEYYIDELNKEKAKTSVLEIEIEKLEKRDNFLCSLEAAGVDNWEGFDIAIDIMNGEND